MKRSLLTGLILFCVFFIQTVSAEERTISIEESLNLALENNADLIDASISLESSKRAERYSWNNYLPSLTASLRLAGNAVSESFSTTLTPGISLNYSLNPGIAQIILQLQLAVEKEEISFESARLNLIMSVETEFYYLLTAESNLKIEKNNIELAKKQLEQTTAKYNSGMASELQVLQARVNVENLKPSYSSLVSSYNNRLKEFLLVLGLDPQEDVKLSGSLEFEDIVPDSEVLISAYLMNRTDIRTNKKNLEVLNSNLKLANANGFSPTFSLSASWSDAVSDPFSGDTWSSRSYGGSTSVSLGVSLGLDDFIPGSSTKIDIEELKDSISQAELALNSLVQEAELEVLNLIDSINTDKENVELSKLNLELAQKSYDMTARSFERGTTDRITLDDSQQDLLTAQQNLIESRYEYLADLISLSGALGLDSIEYLK